MSTYTDASLIITPNSYKAGKLYSIKPTSGAGDLDVVRATSATRVNEQGLVEIPRTNLLLRSEEFDNAYWVKNSVSVTANNTSSPSGTMTADLVANTLEGGHINNTSFVGSIGSVYSFSFYIKNNTSTSTAILVRDTSTVLSATINWSGANISSITNTVGSISSTALTNGWFLIRGTYTAVENNQKIRIYPQSGSGTNSVFLWGAQLEVGNVATEYIPTTSVIRTKFSGITQDGGSASNIPRLDYTNATCPSILVEPQRTNQFIFCSDLSNSIWSKTNYALSSVAPIQGLTATRVTKNSVNNGLYIGTGARDIIHIIGTSAPAIKTFSCLIRKGNTNKVGLVFNNILVGALTTISTEFNFTTKTFTNTSAGLTVSYENYTTDIYRFILTFNDIGTATNKAFWIAPIDNSNNTVTDGYLDIAYVQLEAGANATSYIPTTSSTVTRNADLISKSDISSLINSEAGTIYYEGSALANNTSARVIELNQSMNALTNNVYFRYEPTNNLIAFTVFSGGVLQCNFNYTLPLTQINNYKMAFVWALNRFEIWINGIKVAEDTLGNPPLSSSLNKIIFYDRNSISYFEGKIKTLAIFKNALSNSELAQLTTI